jgi:N-acetylglutamate synthase-like GNAT family acetyltransferase
MEIRIRHATTADVPRLGRLIDASVRGLQTGDYTPDQIEGALAVVYGVDTQLIVDGTYFVAEACPGEGDAAQVHPPGSHVPDTSHASTGERVIVGCGGWSRRATLFGADHCAGREDSLLDPRTDAAKIRAFFVHPDWARRGIGTLILKACEHGARNAGFVRLEMGATLTGVPFYRARGYAEFERIEVPLENGVSMPIVRMVKTVQ